MKVYQQIAATESSVLNLDINVDNLELGFLVAAGTGNPAGDGLLNSGFVL
jgi:NAD(P)H-hydrate repair Nnr-like enzyme with NAD(P)H-hydrate epimerase domain